MPPLRFARAPALTVLWVLAAALAATLTGGQTVCTNITAITGGWSSGVYPISKPGTPGTSDPAGTVFIFYTAASCPPTTGLCSGSSCAYGCLFCADGHVQGVNATAGTFIGLAKVATTGALAG